jgi:hypothetical protein
MKRILLGLWLALLPMLVAPALAQNNVRPIYDNTVNGGTTATPVDPAHPLPVQIAAPGGSTPATVLATSLPTTLRLDAAQTVTSGSAYSAGNTVGGLITFTNAIRAAGLGGSIQSCVFRDTAGQAGTYDLFFFDQTPSGTTVTDKTALAIAVADIPKIVGTTSFATAIVKGGTPGAITNANMNLRFKPSAGTSLFGILVTRGTPTYTSTTAVTLTCAVQPD